jgi:glycosyltransferase involved in cell wall biosynthesis
MSKPMLNKNLENVQSELISCLCITKNSFELLLRAITCYALQTPIEHVKKELIIVYEAPSIEIIAKIKSSISTTLLGEITFVPIQNAQRKVTLGEMRNLSVALARGKYVAQWDDDDIYHPSRLKEQYEALQISAPDVLGNLLNQRLLYDGAKRKVYLSNRTFFEGSIFCLREVFTKGFSMYAHSHINEDTAMVGTLLKKGQLEMLNRPRLYLYIYHGDNILKRDHWECIFDAATEISDIRSERIMHLCESFHDINDVENFLKEALSVECYSP